MDPRASVGVSVEALRAEERRQPPAWKVWVALWTVYLVWGSTYLAIKVAVETLPPLLHAGVRFGIAGGVMYAFLWARLGRERVAVTRREVGAAAIVGTALLLGGNGLVALAERDVPSSLAALVIASVPLWVVLMRFFTGERVGGWTLAGVVLGFGGVALLLTPGSSGNASLWGQLLLVAAAVSWAGGSFVSQRLSLPSNLFVSSAVQMLCGGAVLVVASVVTGEVFSVRPERFSGASVLAVAYLVVAGSLAAFTAYTWLLQKAPISKVATYAYVNPVVAVLLGWVFAAEPVTATILVGATLIVASVAFIVRQETQRVTQRVAVEPRSDGAPVSLQHADA
jgi:drug/metabolite transporter (DMT)-like permease